MAFGIGGCIGTILAPIIVHFNNSNKLFYTLDFLSIIFSIFMFTNNLFIFIFARLIIWILSGVNVTVVPIIIKKKSSEVDYKNNSAIMPLCFL